MTPEKTIQNEILRTFGTRPDLRIWRANVGAARYQGQVVTFGVPGQADLTGILPVTVHCPACGLLAGRVGMRLEIEVKRLDGRQSLAQERYQRLIQRFGGCYVLAHSVGDVWRAIGPHLTGATPDQPAQQEEP